jgi:hypothetical protein
MGKDAAGGVGHPSSFVIPHLFSGNRFVEIEQDARNRRPCRQFRDVGFAIRPALEKGSGFLRGSVQGSAFFVEQFEQALCLSRIRRTRQAETEGQVETSRFRLRALP